MAWLSWEGGTAIGIRRLRIRCAPGQITADGKEAGAAVVAFDLGMRNGKRMHQKIEWFFPEYGQRFDPNSYINIRTGEYHNR
ncbi:hypothetical protein [Frankia sp. CiP3]|uniref:hypothetical protein n=1 Tax=Frankia sp. CiP3 TaxID=2880971 RepID=UPI001EF42014|nr:hypothetical protein [Frankia sp. CiP3]